MKDVVIVGSPYPGLAHITESLIKKGYRVLHEPEHNESGKDFVFILEPFSSYRNDGVRTESEEVQMKERELLVETYRNRGYSPVVVPIFPPEGRVKFILDSLHRGVAKGR